MHCTKKLTAKLHNESARGTAYSSTLQIHCETIAYGNRGALCLVLIFVIVIRQYIYGFVNVMCIYV